MRVLMSAYACEPDKGSEPEVGLQALLAAASRHEVWLISRSNNIPSLEACLAGHPFRARIHLIGADLPATTKRLKHLGGLGTLHLYHHLWQRHISGIARRLDAEVDFDVVHHVTFGAYWIYAGVSQLDKPFVWGPLGGGVRPPWRLLPVMGVRGATEDLLRMTLRPVVARLVRSRQMAARASVILAQNPETARAIGRPEKTRVLPHGLVAAVRARVDGAGEPGHLVTAGRLIGWKAVALALAVMKHLPEETLTIYGDGPDRKRLARLADRAGLTDRVMFAGRVSRHQLLEEIAGARALLHPALHDDSPLIVAEALSLGTPVVCLRRGGPPVLLGYWPRVPARAVDASSPAATAAGLADAIRAVAGQRSSPNGEPALQFAKGILQAYEDAVAS
jgi:glycosyltransferase involved in cell wall biosynthesis